MKFITVALSLTLLVLSTATAFQDIFRKCVSLKNCPSVVSKLQELSEEHTRLSEERHLPKNNYRREFLEKVRKTYFCGYYFEARDPAIICPVEFPEGFAPKIRRNKRLLVYKNQKKKELLKVCGQDYSYRMPRFGNRTELSDYPWMTLLQFENSRTGERKFLCGGVLISDRHVLTAAHCVTSPWNTLISVRLGEHDTTTNYDCMSDGVGGKICTDPAKDVEVAEWITHPNYNNGVSPRLDGSEDLSDLAIVKLKNKVTFNYDVHPICLPEKAELQNQRYEVGGWSTTMVPYAKSLPQKLRSSLDRLSPEECYSYPVNPEYSSDDHICAGGGDGEACIADSGGPLMAPEVKEDRIPRITVYGVGFMELPCSSDRSNIPGVFTKVHKYMPWIEEVIF